MPNCAVCSRPEGQRQAIEAELLVAIPPYYHLGRRYGLRGASLQRHWASHMPDARARARSALPGDPLRDKLTVRQGRVLMKERAEVLPAAPSFSGSALTVMGSPTPPPAAGPIRDARGRLSGGNPGNSGGKAGRSGRPRTKLDVRREMEEARAQGMLPPPRPDPVMAYLKSWLRNPRRKSRRGEKNLGANPHGGAQE